MPLSPSQPSRRPQSSSARIGALATLPVFFDLKGKPVLLIGGSEAAAWKAELLAAAGAHLEVHAPAFSTQMLDLAARPDLNGSITLIQQPWSRKVFTNKSLAVGDAETEGEAKAIFCAARAAGVPVNVIDKPAYCTFKFGSIVNRSPVVIGISTDGAAPVLGQAIRTRIEALLPASLAQWAQLAKDIRGIVLQRYGAGPERRQFWARFARLSFGPFAENETWQPGVEGTLKAVPSVTILTAPRLDPGLLTLNNVRALQGADAIYFDTAVDAAILDHARREAARHELDDGAFSYMLLPNVAKRVLETVNGGQNVLLVRSDGKRGKVTSELLINQLAELCVPLRNCEGKPFRHGRQPPVRCHMKKVGNGFLETMNS